MLGRECVAPLIDSAIAIILSRPRGLLAWPTGGSTGQMLSQRLTHRKSFLHS